MTPDQHLTDLLDGHAGFVQRLLPPQLWPLRPCKVEQFGPLTKYTLGEVWPGTWAMLHRLDAPDAGPPHDHPCPLVTHVLRGGYAETEYYEHGGHVLRTWEPGSSHYIAPDCIHTITRLLDGDCWTLCFAGPVVRQWQHYPHLPLYP